MRRDGGYTANPDLAMGGLSLEQDALCGPAPGSERARRYASLEPEAIDPGEVDRLSRPSRERFDAERERELGHRAARSRSTKLRNLQTESLRGDVDLSRQWAQIDRALDLAARILSQRKRAL